MIARSPTQPRIPDREFLEIRSRLLDIAASLDRVQRSAAVNVAGDDARFRKIRGALALLLDDQPDRAARIQMVFSEPYDSAWRSA